MGLLFIAGAEYARLTDEHYSVHFPEESLTDQIVIPGTEGRFSGMTFGED